MSSHLFDHFKLHIALIAFQRPRLEGWPSPFSFAPPTAAPAVDIGYVSVKLRQYLAHHSTARAFSRSRPTCVQLCNKVYHYQYDTDTMDKTLVLPRDMSASSLWRTSSSSSILISTFTFFIFTTFLLTLGSDALPPPFSSPSTPTSPTSPFSSPASCKERRNLPSKYLRRVAFVMRKLF